MRNKILKSVGLRWCNTCTDKRLSQQCFLAVLALTFCLIFSVTCLHGTTLCSLFQGPYSCTQERVYWAKKAWCEEWGKTFWSHPMVHWRFLSSTVSYSNVKSTWSYLSSLPTSVTSLSAKQSLSHNVVRELVPCHQLMWYQLPPPCWEENRNIFLE